MGNCCSISATRESLSEKIDKVFENRKQIDAELLDELEEALIAADLGVTTTLEILDKVRRGISRKEIGDIDALSVKEQASGPTHILLRGNPRAAGETVTPGIPEVLGRDIPSAAVGTVVGAMLVAAGVTWLMLKAAGRLRSRPRALDRARVWS